MEKGVGEVVGVKVSKMMEEEVQGREEEGGSERGRKRVMKKG